MARFPLGHRHHKRGQKKNQAKQQDHGPPGIHTIIIYHACMHNALYIGSH